VIGEEDIAASAKSRKIRDKLGASGTGSDSENNCDDSCEVVVPKLSEVLENMNDDMVRREWR
jgi:hypothetical protein